MPQALHPRTPTLLFREAAEAAQAVRVATIRNRAALAELSARLRAQPPRVVVTCARGSSDHAATYAKYLIETRTGCIVASAAPSICSVYSTRMQWQGALFLAISQSGKSPDLLAAAKAARAGGALVVSLVNVEDSPLAGASDYVLALSAGSEQSVAASKSFIAALAAILQLVAAWTQDPELKQASNALPDLLEQAWALDWQSAEQALQQASHLFVLGRGLGLAIAQEAALKCKETSGLHAEAFSGAEVQHGPQALLNANFPALLLVQEDETEVGMHDLAQSLLNRGVRVLMAARRVPPGAIALPAISADPAIQPILLAQSFYRMINGLSLNRGFNPDQPPHLRKVTETH
ncbi:SIS domain-containing protein [Ahniella affigens]|nr:SIS domain-containing protein [Ahniella affigens]